MIGVGEKFPEFEMNGVIGNHTNPDQPDHDFVTVNSWSLTDWSIIYFYPKDFTFICPTEIVAMDKLMNETTDIIGISGDNEYCKFAWRSCICECIILDIRCNKYSKYGVLVKHC